MKVGVLKESFPGERRVALTREGADRLIKSGAEVLIETQAGVASGFLDKDYINVGAGIAENRGELIRESDIILKVRKPDEDDIRFYKNGAIHIGFLNPWYEKPLINKMARAGVTALAMELMPRLTITQKMDALSSQANLAGYASVIIAAERLSKIFPIMTTPSGTIPPARVFVIGAGIAGLQAIATAKRLGAMVEAYDTRPAVAEQVQSLGARFVKADVGRTGQTKAGYAKELSDKQLDVQREVMTRYCADADIVITAAQVFGKKAPLIVTKEMIKKMRAGSVIVDLAVESGGNVEGVKFDREIEVNGVRLIGSVNLPSYVALDASRMYSNNLVNLIEQFWDKEEKIFKVNLADKIMSGCAVTHRGKIVNEMIRSRFEGGK